MKLSTLALVGLLGVLFPECASAQGTLLELRQDATRYNLGSTNGLPLSTNRSVTIGSDGRAPTPAQQIANGLTVEAATPNQFRTLVVFGGLVSPSTNALPGLAFSDPANAVALDLPRGPAPVKLILTSARVGAPVLQRQVTVQFGQVILPPDKNEFGVLLSTLQPPQSPEDYWRAEPYTTTGHSNQNYYYSPHAREVFAVQPGNVEIVWQRSVPSRLTRQTNNAANVTNQSGITYVVQTNTYLVSSAPVKPARPMYWTEKTFHDTGKAVSVPSALVGEIKVVYNNNFPQRTTNEIVIPGVEPRFMDTNSLIQETRTLWHDQDSKQIRAYNVEGRAFLEILGDQRSDGNRVHLGFEIVDVSRQPAPSDVTIELGEKLTAYSGGEPSDETLFPEPLLQLGGQSFTHQHVPGGGARSDYYAVRETINQNDLQVHWLATGVQGLKWPFRFVRYRLVWPEDVGKYSHYVRPRVDTETEAKATAIPLPTDNGPAIAYQDPLDQPRGKLTESYAYYSWLSREYPAHRALLRFTSGSHIRFERVFSWLDEGLRDLRFGFASDFAAAPVGGTTYGGADVAKGRLVLVNSAQPANGGLLLDGVQGDEPVRSFRATFLLNLRGSPPSGGLSFNFGTLGDGGNSGAELGGTDDGLSVGFRVASDMAGRGAPGIQIKWNGVPVPSGFVARDLATSSTNFTPVEIVLNEGGAMDVFYNNTRVLNRVQTGFVPRAGRFGFASIGPVVRNAWQIADRSTSAGSLYYSTNLTEAQRVDTTNTGWRFTVVSRVAEGSGGTPGAANPGNFMTYGHGDRRFLVGWDRNASGRLTATLYAGSSNITSVLALSGSTTTNYHRHELVYDPGTRLGTYRFDGTNIASWAGIDGDTNFVGQAVWGATGAPGITDGAGRMNYHQVQFALGVENSIILSEYFAGVQEDSENPPKAPDPADNGWTLTWTVPSSTTVTNAPVSPDVVTPYSQSIDNLSILVNRTNNPASIAFEGSVATNLASWNTNGFQWPDLSLSPRVVSEAVFVGQRIVAPKGELGASDSDVPYLAGYLRQSEGNSFHALAYRDPFVDGFETANGGAIIPINAIPGRNRLEAWWFRNNRMNPSPFFKPVLWPSAVGRYTISWPSDAAEIVLASNDGSGALPSPQANGRIYSQNDPELPGYNPNEEHALMQGGQAWALRDDLNITTNTNGEYSSHPFVLLSYTDSDGRPSVQPFRVLREKPEAGIVFDYTRQAGLILQPPMPLPLLEKPLAPVIPGQPPHSLNTEIDAYIVDSSTRTAFGSLVRHTLSTTARHFAKRLDPLSLQDTQTLAVPYWFFPTNVTATTLVGWVSSVPPLQLSLWPGVQNPNPTNYLRFATARIPAGMTSSLAAAFLYEPVGGTNWQVTVSEVNTNSQYVEVRFASALPAAARRASILVLPVPGPTQPDAFAGQRLAPEPLPVTIPDPQLRGFYGKFTFKDRKATTWFYRGPHNPAERPSLVMQFYYRTLPSFYFPSLALDGKQQPPLGTITPYLTPRNADGSPDGDPVYGNADKDQVADGNALGITYRPVWPANAPILGMAETLTTPRRGLPAVRGQTSVEVLYQQSVAGRGTNFESVVLQDPTREKAFALGAAGNGITLDHIPGSVRTSSYQGKTFFPNLPPHLAERFFYDPNRGANGHLVFKGQFVDAPLGDSYLFLNVLSQGDRTELSSLCATNDTEKSKWEQAVSNLSTTLETFIESTEQPGTFVPDLGSLENIGAGEIARIKNDDVAVDSYALTATGPGSGYVSIVAGNGRAFTPEGDPVSVKILKVADTLYRGEVNIVESSNPLNEKLVMQQVVDLAAKVEDYNFEWRMAAPVDGLPPEVYSLHPVMLLRGAESDSPWTHLRYPLPADSGVSVAGSEADRLSSDDGSVSVVPVSSTGVDKFTSLTLEGDHIVFGVAEGTKHGLSPGNRVTLRKTDGAGVFGTVHGLTTASAIHVTVDPNQQINATPDEITALEERQEEGAVQSIVFKPFTTTNRYPEYWLSLDVNNAVGVVVYIDGQLAARGNTGLDDTATTVPPSELSPLPKKVYRLSPALFAGGTRSGITNTHLIAIELISRARAGTAVRCNARLEAFDVDDLAASGNQWLPLDAQRYSDGVRAILGGAGDVQSLGDNYLIMRYQAKKATHASFLSDGRGGNAAWSEWTAPQLAEGWIKRVLKGINPFNQRVTDLFNNAVSTDVSLISQAGPRWEGDVALNLDNLNNTGLIEIYETVLGRGKDLSINSDINYGPANDALLLAAGYLNDLYMLLGNEAYADAANPTIGFGTKDSTYGDIATALFAFKGQLPTLLEEELALLRGRDDALLPGVELRPVYNRLVWNYTRGIDAGEVVYALNYNILDQNNDGKSDADDARRLYPQGHGDAYGHYLTALKGYYKLLLNPNFSWVPRIEAVTVLGKPVSVDYQDERKFAAAAAAFARAGRQIFDLTWRRDYQSGTGQGWAHFAQTKDKSSHGINRTRAWAMDHWATRAGSGAYINWVIGNAILPDHDPDTNHLGSIQQVDRTTVPELQELAIQERGLQTALDNAEAGLTPMGLPESAIPFDLDPIALATGPTSHFEQVFQRAKEALNNAVVSFDDAKDVTRLMRSEEDSLAELRASVAQQELAYTNSLIELYGTPYPDDVGPGRTYRSGYNGPDTIHYMYVDNKELNFTGPQGDLLNPASDVTWRIDTQTFQAGWADGDLLSTFNFIQPARRGEIDGLPATIEYLANTNLYVEYVLSSHGFFKKPKAWKGQRSSPGRIQQAISDIVKARNAAYEAFYSADAGKYDLDWAIRSLEEKKNSQKRIREVQEVILGVQESVNLARAAYDVIESTTDWALDPAIDLWTAEMDTSGVMAIVGTADGTDYEDHFADSAMDAGIAALRTAAGAAKLLLFAPLRALEAASDSANRWLEYDKIAPEAFHQELRGAVSELRDKVYGMNNNFMAINARLQELDDAQRAYRSAVAEGDRIQMERQVFRQRTAAVIQGFRTRDAAFRIFRNEKLERYKSLYDLAAKYTFMAAQAYDYDTGLLHTGQGREFINRIIRSRALGVVRDGNPQFAGSNTGDPGLSSVLAELAGDWTVVRGRLGFNNPDVYGTTLSLRTENFRILPTAYTYSNNVAVHDADWKGILNRARTANLLDDPDVRRYCMQIDPGNGLPVPGLVVEFSTTIADGLNFFGQPLAPWDHAFSSSSFATKIYALGVAFEGYQGMDDPNTNDGAVSGAGGVSPGDPNLAFLDPNAMAATPYIYVIPVGVDSMRSPPLGDQSVTRTWNVQDVTIPLPFNIGGSDYSSKQLWQSDDSLSEPLFNLRKHQAFRPVSTASVFGSGAINSAEDALQSRYTSTRLVGRSVWNSKWKIVIPGKTLLNNPEEGLERFIRSVHDIKLYLMTYSYSGN